MSISAIYLITGPNDKMYVGSAHDYMKRWRDHKHSLRKGNHHSLKLQNAWNKHGEDKFSFELLEVVQDVSQILIREQHWLDTLNVYKTGYNMTPDARSGHGRKHSEETKQRLREINSMPEFRAAHSAHHKGKVVSEETRAKQRAAKLGIPKSEETKAKMRAAHAKRKLQWA